MNNIIQKEFNLVGFSLTKHYVCDLSFCKGNADSNTYVTVSQFKTFYLGQADEEYHNYIFDF